MRRRPATGRTKIQKYVVGTRNRWTRPVPVECSGLIETETILYSTKHNITRVYTRCTVWKWWCIVYANNCIHDVHASVFGYAFCMCSHACGCEEYIIRLLLYSVSYCYTYLRYHNMLFKKVNSLCSYILLLKYVLKWFKNSLLNKYFPFGKNMRPLDK